MGSRSTMRNHLYKPLGPLRSSSPQQARDKYSYRLCYKVDLLSMYEHNRKGNDPVTPQHLSYHNPSISYSHIRIRREKSSSLSPGHQWVCCRGCLGQAAYISSHSLQIICRTHDGQNAASSSLANGGANSTEVSGVGRGGGSYLC
jgi:hypothetical protein